MRFITGMFAVALVAFATTARAAEIEPYNDPYLDCIVKVSGVIGKGDAARLEEVLVQLLGKGRTVEQVRDSCFGDTIGCINSEAKRICLSSPGGSFSEAIKIAELVQGFMGTAVPRGAECLSACSVVFMAGSHATGEDAGIIANRKLHAGGRLGFHAPSLEVAAGAYSEAQVNKAYKIAVLGLGQLMRRASDMKLSQTLVAEMLATPPDEFFYIDTVHKAGRWLIPVVGTVYPEKITPLAVSNACNAYYGWTGDRLATNGFGFEPDPAYRWGWDPEIRRNEYRPELDVKMEGFGQEGALFCSLNIQLEASPDDARSLWGDYASIWMGEDGIGFEASPATFFDPRTSLSALVRPLDSELVFRDVADFTPVDRVVKETRCFVFKGQQKLDEDPCRRETDTTVKHDLAKHEISAFIWPSGGRTVLIDDGSKTTINGQPARMLFDRKPVDSAHCYLNSGSGNTFCFAYDH